VHAEARDGTFEAGEVAGLRRGWRDCLPRPLERLRELGDADVESNDGRTMVPGGPVVTGRLLGMVMGWVGQESLLIGMLLDEPQTPRDAERLRCRPAAVPARVDRTAPATVRRA
jgi:hypothetical protein